MGIQRNISYGFRQKLQAPGMIIMPMTENDGVKLMKIYPDSLSVFQIDIRVAGIEQKLHAITFNEIADCGFTQVICVNSGCVICQDGQLHGKHSLSEGISIIIVAYLHAYDNLME